MLDYLFCMKAWAGDPIDQRDLHEIGGYSRGELTREVQILLESLFE